MTQPLYGTVHAYLYQDGRTISRDDFGPEGGRTNETGKVGGGRVAAIISRQTVAEFRQLSEAARFGYTFPGNMDRSM